MTMQTLSAVYPLVVLGATRTPDTHSQFTICLLRDREMIAGRLQDMRQRARAGRGYPSGWLDDLRAARERLAAVGCPEAGPLPPIED